MESTPIVVDGVMYVTSAWSVVYAYDAKTGERLWKYDPKVDKARGVSACCDVVNRGVAIWEGKVFVGTIDGRLDRARRQRAPERSTQTEQEADLGGHHGRPVQALHDHRRAARGRRAR